MNIAEKLTTIAENISKVYDSGKQEQYDEFWNDFQKFGEHIRTDYQYAFYHWYGEYIRPKYKIIPKSTSLDESIQTIISKYNNMVYGCPNLKKIEKEYFDLSQYYHELSYNTQSTYGNYYTFANNPNLEEIEDVGMQPYTYYNTFRWCPKLHTIEVVRSNEKTIFDQQVFHSCLSLKNIKIEGVITSNISFHTNTKLSKESIISIITALSDTVGATLTLTQTAVNNAFTTDEWNSLKSTKSNWEIKLV